MFICYNIILNHAYNFILCLVQNSAYCSGGVRTFALGGLNELLCYLIFIYLIYFYIVYLYNWELIKINMLKLCLFCCIKYIFLELLTHYLLIFTWLKTCFFYTFMVSSGVTQRVHFSRILFSVFINISICQLSKYVVFPSSIFFRCYYEAFYLKLITLMIEKLFRMI